MQKELLHTSALKATKKRELILQIMKEESRPMTADEIYEKTSGLLTMNVSTVYRALHLMTEKGILEKTVRQDKKAYYTLRRHDHCHHLVCTECHAVIPIDSCPLEELAEALEKETGFQITGHSLQFDGICPVCAKKASEQKG